MEVDVDQWVLKAATLLMEGNVHPSVAIIKAFDQVCPEAKLYTRVTDQLREYKKLTMWRD